MHSMQAQMQTAPAPIGITASASIFAVYSILLWLTVRNMIRWLRDTFGILPILGWYISGTAFVLVPPPTLRMRDGLARTTRAQRGCIKKSPEAPLDGSRRRDLGYWRASRYRDCFGLNPGSGALHESEFPSLPLVPA